MIRIENLYLKLSEFHLSNINLRVEKGEFFVLLGPTGAGKTVLLEAIVGLIPVKKGKICIRGIDATNLAPEARNVAIVYQDCALFPHLTVLDNIKYGLHFHQLDKVEIDRRLNQLIEQLQLTLLLNRLPINLSGGEMQRVALARALVVNPSILLLDEPLSALDPNFKEEIREILKQLHQTTGLTFFMVSHDFTDVLCLATKAAVMNQGRIEQAGEVTDIFQRPSSSFVANFLGVKNIFQGSVINYAHRRLVDTGKIKIEVGKDLSLDSEKVYFMIRPEDIIVSEKPLLSSARNCFLGKVTKIVNRGEVFYIILDIGEKITALITKASLEDMGLKKGDKAFFTFKATAVHLFI